MPTPKKGPRLGNSAKNQKHILSNLTGALIEHGAVKTTDAKAKLLRPYVEKIITKAKSGTVADRRNVAKLIPQKDLVAKLFDELAPQFEGREGGYTRIVKLGIRRGDAAPISQISLVLEPTVTTEATKATKAHAKKAEKAEEAAAVEAEEAPEVEADEATDEAAEAEAAEAEAEETADEAEAEKTADEAEAEK
ncbi:MAG: 50S ribosomal protein L17 [Corynebacterium sp.]|nr:50S ribosomal protein L17 [Corynebacterium sp.]